MDKGTVYFFTGLSGAGKTTIGGLLYRRMKAKRNDVVLLDGDQLRRLSFHKKSGYTTEERRRGAYYNFEMCKMLADQGIDVVLCSISMYHDCRSWLCEEPEAPDIVIENDGAESPEEIVDRLEVFFGLRDEDRE